LLNIDEFSKNGCLLSKDDLRGFALIIRCFIPLNLLFNQKEKSHRNDYEAQGQHLPGLSDDPSAHMGQNEEWNDQRGSSKEEWLFVILTKGVNPENTENKKYVQIAGTVKLQRIKKHIAQIRFNAIKIVI